MGMPWQIDVMKLFSMHGFHGHNVCKQSTGKLSLARGIQCFNLPIRIPATCWHVGGLRLSGHAVVVFRPFGDLSDEVALGLGVADTVILMRPRKPHLEPAVLLGNAGMLNEVVPE